MIITYPLNGIEYSAQDAETYLSSRTSGLFSDEVDFIPSGMTVTISPFLAWIKNTQFSGKSVAVTEPVEITISPADSTLDRIDRIVLRFSASKNASEIAVLEGEASSFPVAKELTRDNIVYELCLAEVLVYAGLTSLSSLAIRSTILDEELCGLMRDGVTRIPTANLERQVEELLDDLRRELESVEDESNYLLKNGNVAMTGDFNNGGFKSVNLADPEDEKDAVNKSYVDENFLPARKWSGIDFSETAYYEGSVFSPLPDGTERWINPPMLENEEYKTLEFLDGDPIWTKIVACGALPNTGAKTITLFDDDAGVEIVDFNTVVFDDNEGSKTVQKFPCYSASGQVVAIGYIDATGKFTIRTFSDLSFCSCYVVIKYMYIL